LNDKLYLNCITQLLPDYRTTALRVLQEKVMEDNCQTASKEYVMKLLDKYTKQYTYKVLYVGILLIK